MVSEISVEGLVSGEVMPPLASRRGNHLGAIPDFLSSEGLAL